MSVFITNLSNLSEKELSYAATLEKNDKVIVFHQENMVFPNFATVYLGLSKLKAKLEFILMPTDVNEPSFLFQLGALSTENDVKNFILVYPADSHVFNIKTLNDLTFATASGQGKVSVCDSFKAALKYASSKTIKKKPQNPRTHTIKKENFDDSFIPLNNNKEPFNNLLYSLEDGIVNIKKYSEEIRKSIKDSSDQIGLEILLSTNLKNKELGNEIYNLIKHEYAKLKKYA